MNEDTALLVARTLVALSAAIVLVRSALAAGTRRERSRSPLQLASLAMVASVALLFGHPAAIATVPWYDALVRPAGLLLMLVAGTFVVWAYVRLGRYWDAAISALPDHRVVQDGPFAVVRHPIYAGLLGFLAGGALLVADPLVAAVALAMVPVLLVRARAEERFLEERLGDEYRDYRRRVPMLLPRLRR